MQVIIEFWMFQATAIVNSGLLLMAVMGLLFPAVLHFTHTEVHFGKSQLALSRFSSCIMLIAYASYLFFQLKSQPNLYSSVSEVDDLILSVWFSFDSLLLFHCITFFAGVIKCLKRRLRSAHISNSSRDELRPKYMIVVLQFLWYLNRMKSIIQQILKKRRCPR